MTIILGIDPGSRVTGYGIIRDSVSRMEYIDSGCIRTASPDFSARLLEIYQGILGLMQAYKPEEVAIESLFMHVNVSSALKLGHARGAAMVAVMSQKASVYEYAPREIKQAVVGYGAAEKHQIQHMVVQFLSLNRAPQKDAADALAIAICHGHMRKNVHRITRRKK